MNIGFDAKRAFHNNTGLGNYSRTLINGLAEGFPEHAYFLFNPKSSTRLYQPKLNNIHEVLPVKALHQKFPWAWRSYWLAQDLKAYNLQIFHGLSGELPINIRSKEVKTVVTIHDLIFEKYPEQYGKIDRFIYGKKFRHACKAADKIIAISKQTQTDLIELYHADPAKITVCYQSCDPVFALPASASLTEKIRSAYQLPDSFFLYVGSIIERKNLLRICMALQSASLSIPLVVVGNGSAYKRKVKSYIAKTGMDDKVIFLSEKVVAEDLSLNKPANLAALYQMSLALVYPSLYEGFGIPVLEALWSRLPVITSNTSCLPETAGNAAWYVNPLSVPELTKALQSVAKENNLRAGMIEKGLQHAANFTLEKCTASVMNVYESMI